MTGMGGKPPQKEDSFGNPSEHYDLRIINNKGEECPPLKEGNFVIKVKPIRPVGLFTGYITEGPDGPVYDTEKNDSCFVGDYYITGDRGYKDEEGNAFYRSRADDVISSAGYRIGPFEVESAIQTHPSVVESAVVASPDSLRGEIVKAFIVLTDEVKYRKGLDKRKLAKEIQEHVKTQTAPYKYPRKVEFVDSLPKTISGKILRRELKMLEFS
jgi:acyl-coenzyme A synthetase/AMP-(fatty) acid ligase